MGCGGSGKFGALHSQGRRFELHSFQTITKDFLLFKTIVQVIIEKQ